VSSTRLYLVRHAEPDRSVRGRVYGRLDPGLSERGHAQAEALASWLRDLPLAAVYVSPRRRAVETALPLCGARALEPCRVEALRELDFGDWEGQRYEDIATSAPALYQAWMENPTEITFPGGESYTLLRARVLAALRDIVRKHPEACVALLAHGGTHRVVLGHALGLRDRDVFRLDLSYASVSVVDLLADTAIVRLVNASPPEGPAPRRRSVGRGARR
jgi:broad specificity phosphatase PhoE